MCASIALMSDHGLSRSRSDESGMMAAAPRSRRSRGLVISHGRADSIPRLLTILCASGVAADGRE